MSRVSRVGILYPGALGGALGRAIAEAGDTPITCLRGRSATTCRRALAANFVVVSSLEEVARTCDIVISLVPPAKAVEVALSFAACAPDQCADNAEMPTFIDANSVAARTKKHIADVLSTAGVPCIDGAFLGPANRIGTENVMLLSGAAAARVGPVFRKAVEARVVGDEVGQASSLKMTMAIVTKALPALFLEMVCASAKRGQLGPALDLMRRLYPGILGFLERTLPTYPVHIARRVFELTEVRDWLRELDQSAVMTGSAVAVLERFRLQGFESEINWRFEDLLDAIGATDLLSTDKAEGAARDPARDSSQISIAPPGPQLRI
jgi:3-hydroxyisobutyrate dehydrogenase-like beta-hydroxyacid dehydrogenase